jgi:AraC-like DNA-binding protein
MSASSTNSGSTVSMVLLSGFFEGMRVLRLDTAAIAKRADVPLPTAPNPRARVPQETITRVWEAAIEVSGNEAIGLMLVQLMRPGALDLVDYLIRTSNTIAEAIMSAGRFARLMDSSIGLSLEIEEDVVRLSENNLDPTRRHWVTDDVVLGSMIVLSRQSTGEHLLARQVHFTHAPPKDRSEYDRLFECELVFNASQNMLVFDSGILKVPLLKADRYLNAVLERQAVELLEQVPTAPSLRHDVRELIASELHAGNPTAKWIAHRLGLSTRTLRRRLHDEGTSYQYLLDSVRQQVALKSIRNPSTPLHVIATQLGFSGPSAFNKAFRRWTGSSPEQYRKRNRY